MKKLSILGLILLISLAFGFGNDNKQLTNRVQFATLDKAKELLTTEDQFTKGWSKFDINSRMQKNYSSKDELLKFISNQALEWTQAEKDKISLILQNIDMKISNNGFKLNLPKEIFFIKTTVQEEAGINGYSRANYIVFNENFIAKPNNLIEELIIHNLFHIITRNDPGLKKKMYEIIGFKMMDEIYYPDSLKNFRITIADAPETNSFITLKMDGKTVDFTMILYSLNRYFGGAFYEYMNVGLLKLKGLDAKEIDYVNGKPVIFTVQQVPDFYEKIGRNTQRILSPDEILAENFLYAVNNRKSLKSQFIVDKIQSYLRE